MVDSIAQVGLILLLVVPGYISYSLKETWVSFREKAQFDKLLSSLIYSVFVWALFSLVFKKTPLFYLGNLQQLIGLKHICVLVLSVLFVGWLSAFIENKGWLFKIGKLASISVKTNQGAPLLEDIFNDTTKELAEIHVYTEDGAVHRGINRIGKNMNILIGAHPYSGDVSFVCDWAKKAEEEAGKDKNPQYDEKGFILRTYIPKERISKIVYKIK